MPLAILAGHYLAFEEAVFLFNNLEIVQSNRVPVLAAYSSIKRSKM